MSNYNEIIDGVQDQIDALTTARSNYESQIVALQAELDKIGPRLVELQSMLSNAQSLATNSIDINLNLNLNGSSLRSFSTPVSAN